MSEPDPNSPQNSPAPGAPVPPVDAGSRALEEALRSSFTIVKVAMVVLIGVFLFSGMKIIGPQERAVILRFGKPIGTGLDQLLGPGLHWAWPAPIDEVVKIPVTEIQRVTSTIGWYTLGSGPESLAAPPFPSARLNPATAGYLVTADSNIIQARATLGYRITDPIAYSFNFLNASNLVQNALNNALVYAAASSTVDDAMLNNTAFKEKVLARLRQQVDVLKLGITLEQGSEVRVVAPQYVKPDFDAVTSAQQDRDTAISQARGRGEAIVRGAEAEANAIIRTAETERVRAVQRVQSDATYFAKLLPEYQKSPESAELIRERLRTETWSRILAHAPDKFISLEPLTPGQTELWLQISREPQKRKTGTQP
jgi:membrane protease subunit HflK